MTAEEKDICEKLEDLETIADTMSTTTKMSDIMVRISIRLMKKMAEELQKTKEENAKLKAQLTDILSKDAT